ncbi:selenocysteine-specific translation elongation factor [Candidatus Formimonas warabiya]|uniref:Selenocysteine-specific elongation factor n=1 Tax=Formimonas warabiya TaxID=1761012 RepID=A0A3G1KVC9_FORW1|nr:selenocysteine-specific translation elongation factor [Candidatus Formimonas warabiya]ATW26386.1 selenocysteine-specific translation elongation factor [Candidatus Formimonas warabiya]
MQRIIIGTAGHVDHGKTVLTKRLTGVDTDRLKEEKERGISIELGFAPLTLPSGTKVGLVDVPGHERFIKNMLAGIAGIDLVLLVIAADEGVMPQTREHLDIINLLEVKKGIVVITKSDLVDEEWLELIKQDITQVLAGTVLENAPMVAVSAFTGTGIAELLTMIDKQAQETPPKEVTGKVRIPIDRVFTITGFGTVITGTLWAGRLKVGDMVEILPKDLNVRVRTLQVHGEKVPEATAGQRVAVNLAGVEAEEIERGDVLAEPGLLETSFRMDVRLRLLAHNGISLDQRARVRIHHGTREVLGRINLLDREELLPGDSCFCQLVLETPLMALRGDHYVMRTYSPMITIGGGVIVDPVPGKHKRYKEEVIKTLEVKSLGNPRDLVLQSLSEDPMGMLTPKDIAGKTGLEEPLVGEQLNSLSREGEVFAVAGEGTGYYLTRDRDVKWRLSAQKRLKEFHDKYPLRPGMPKEELRSRDFPNISGKVFNLLVEHWENTGLIRAESQNIAAGDFRVEISPSLEKAIKTIEEKLLEQPFSPPGWEALAEAAGLAGEMKNEVLLWLQNHHRVAKLAEDVLIHNQALEEGKEKIKQYIKEHGMIQLAETRDLLNTSRKYALPLLEYLDQIKFTRRKADTRILFS